MATAAISDFMRRFTRQMESASLAEHSDRQLVEMALSTERDVALGAIVHRHGAMVYRVCCRILQQPQDAEDAFQATFLVLVQKLHSIRKHASLASWLHGIAHRVAVRAKSQAKTLRCCESKAPAPDTTPSDDVTWKEVRAVLDTELCGLPEKLRQPLILCYLEGRTQDEAASELGWSKSTLRRRLEKARDALGHRLTSRGVAPSAAMSAILVSDCIAIGAPAPALVRSTIEATAGVVAGTAVTAATSAKVAALTKGVLKSMLLSQCNKVTMVLVVALGFLVSGGALLYYQAAAGQGNTPIPQGEKTESRVEIPEGVQGRKKLPDWLQKLDADNDGQISLHEWRTAGKSVDEFRKWDLNDDGFITPDEEEAVKRELKKMAGTWQVLSLVVNGANLLAKTDAKNRSAVIKDDVLTVVGGEKESQAALKVNPSKEPREIDIIFTAGPTKGETLRGLYKLEGDYLTICYAGGDVGRPTDFTSKPGSGKSLIVYKRQMP